MKKETLLDIIFSVFILVFLVALTGLIFIVFAEGYQLFSTSFFNHKFSTLETFYVWYSIGIISGLYWPWKYRKGMNGHWFSMLKGLPFLALTGPLALIFGIPM